MRSSELPSFIATTRRGALALGGVIAALAAGGRVLAGSVEERPDLSAIFKEHGASGTFVLYDAVADHLSVTNGARAETRYVPASTFKIVNSLIALEAGVVKDENEIIPYGGKPQPFKIWEMDMPMRVATTASNAAIYQEPARRIGLERYRLWLDRLDYGNRQLGTALETFWLDGPLEISAIEQVKFVTKVAQQKLPFSARSQSIVRDIMLFEKADGRAIYGKTGWRFSSNPQLGWWTGWVERDSRVFAFALNIDITAPEDAKKRIAIGKAILAKLGVW